ncbi:hypothetical protein SKAU_G00102410 [Synaphobranchus kaupii]|uniref:Uncharacterized protein n=1 Tax=Synaphobranchus kaupii TaxID=118154 RepID=A0A9Q1FZM3_SYNKA|nr:hypothetical protein SKAU_G00102410 [Synaphobranchus kaupii]
MTHPPQPREFSLGVLSNPTSLPTFRPLTSLALPSLPHLSAPLPQYKAASRPWDPGPSLFGAPIPQLESESSQLLSPQKVHNIEKEYMHHCNKDSRRCFIPTNSHVSDQSSRASAPLG